MGAAQTTSTNSTSADVLASLVVDELVKSKEKQEPEQNQDAAIVHEGEQTSSSTTTETPAIPIPMPVQSSIPVPPAPQNTPVGGNRPTASRRDKVAAGDAIHDGSSRPAPTASYGGLSMMDMMPFLLGSSFGQSRSDGNDESSKPPPPPETVLVQAITQVFRDLVKETTAPPPPSKPASNCDAGASGSGSGNASDSGSSGSTEPTPKNEEGWFYSEIENAINAFQTAKGGKFAMSKHEIESWQLVEELRPQLLTNQALVERLLSLRTFVVDQGGIYKSIYSKQGPNQKSVAFELAVLSYLFMEHLAASPSVQEVDGSQPTQIRESVVAKLRSHWCFTIVDVGTALGLALYVSRGTLTTSPETAELAKQFESGMIDILTAGLKLPATPNNGNPDEPKYNPVEVIVDGWAHVAMFQHSEVFSAVIHAIVAAALRR